jgi:hypothetical protein
MKIERQARRKTQSSGKARLPRGGNQPSKGFASPRRWHLPAHRSLALTPTDVVEEVTAFLIANPRLKFSLNYRKHSHLQISNRERMHVFQSLATLHSPLATEFLIGNSAIRKSNNMPFYSKMQISNRRRNRPKCLSCGHAFRPQHLVSSTSEPTRLASFDRAPSSNPYLKQRAPQHETHPRHFAHGFVAPGFRPAGFDLGWEDFAWPPQ